MTFRRVLSSVAFVAVLSMASIPVVLAQFGGGLPGMGMPGIGAPGGFGGPPAAAPSAPPPACQQLIALRDERVKNMEALQAARGKADPAEACKMFRALMTVETKFIASLKANSTTCGVPPEVIKQADEGHGKGLLVTKQVCDAADHPRPTGPTLDEMLNSKPQLPDPDCKSKQGVYNTLQGNSLGC